MKWLKPKVTPLYGYDEVCKMTFKVVAANIQEVYDECRRRFSSYCTHSYDCCGCRTYSYSVTPYNRREFKVRLTVGRNY